jgi:hypothetical protein
VKIVSLTKEKFFMNRIAFELVTLFLSSNKQKPMQPLDYRQTIVEALNVLNVAQIKIFTAMVNVGMAGSLSDLADAYDLGEVVDFEIEMFAESGDANLEIIIKLISQMEAARQSLMNLNVIGEDEIEKVAPEE